MKIRIVDSLRDFDALSALWREVTAADGRTSPFLSHDWFACCWRTAGPNRRREAWVFEDGTGPLALVPLVREKISVRGLPARAVRLLDAPNAPFTDFPVVGDRREVMRAFLEALRRHADWDIFVWPRLLADSPACAAFRATLAGSLPTRVARMEHSPYLSVSGTWEEFIDKKDLARHVQGPGGATAEEHREVDPDGRVFADFLQVSQQGWSRAQAATAPATPRFLRELTQRASTNGWLHLWLLRIGGQPVATEYQIGAHGRLHTLHADFDPAFASVSPDVRLSGQIVKTLFERHGTREYDMGAGSSADKLAWATGFHETVALEVYAPTTFGRLLNRVETRLVPLAKRVRAALTSRSA